MATPEQTLLAFDFGTKQIGVAVGQTITQTATPLTVLRATDGIPNWNQVGELIAAWRPDHILVGLPLNMDGTESEICTRARKFARRLQGRFDVSVGMVDERLSTFEAKLHRKPGINYKDDPVDSEAARLILNSWLASPNQDIAP